MLKPTRVVNYLTMKGVAQEIYIRRMAAVSCPVSGRDMDSVAEREAMFSLSAAEAFTNTFNKRCALETSDV